MMNSYISGDLSMGPSDSADTDMEGQLDSDKIDEGEIDFGIHHQFDVNTFGNNMIVYVTMRYIAEKYGLNIEQKFPSFFKDPIKYTPKSNVKKNTCLRQRKPCKNFIRILCRSRYNFLS